MSKNVHYEILSEQKSISYIYGKIGIFIRTKIYIILYMKLDWKQIHQYVKISSFLPWKKSGWVITDSLHCNFNIFKYSEINI